MNDYRLNNLNQDNINRSIQQLFNLILAKLEQDAYKFSDLASTEDTKTIKDWTSRLFDIINNDITLKYDKDDVVDLFIPEKIKRLFATDASYCEQTDFYFSEKNRNVSYGKIFNYNVITLSELDNKIFIYNSTKNTLKMILLVENTNIYNNIEEQFYENGIPQ